ncbi:uncharacterized protein B0H18DRAFT_985163 [Fomitopsis serialis]|uniref:uncharacterized protein n=1 Tax=Fomitopsis serialis TaxID=139415 RepID=UPI002008CA59|nr:uncharacterized protein B0H18DRAFT_985163 [Neoantrodia serialis]KAH9933018.1 hypothetical protein B0H18DRAFT_985163 [Neoantrodia serialis]
MFCRPYIVDYIWDDVPTLRACAVTCHNWVWRAQRHIFRRVIINSASRFERFTRLLKAKPRFALCVRVLVIAKARRGKTKVDKGWPELLQRLRGVEDLTIGRHIDLFTMHEDVRQNLPTLFPRASVGRGEDLACLLSACPSMRALYLDGARMRPPWEQGDSDSSTITHPLHTLGDPEAGARIATSDLFLECRPLLRAVDDTLEELVLSVAGNRLPRRSLAGSLPPLKRLRRVHLRVKIQDTKESTPRRYEWMVRFLRLLSAWEGKEHLSEVVLTWRTSDLSNMKRCPWDEFDAAMTGLAKNTSKLKFTLNILDNSETQNQWLYMTSLGLQCFPSLQQARTTLAVNMGSSWSDDESFGGCLDNPKQWTFNAMLAKYRL